MFAHPSGMNPCIFHESNGIPATDRSRRVENPAGRLTWSVLLRLNLCPVVSAPLLRALDLLFRKGRATLNQLPRYFTWNSESSKQRQRCCFNKSWIREQRRLLNPEDIHRCSLTTANVVLFRSYGCGSRCSFGHWVPVKIFSSVNSNEILSSLETNLKPNSFCMAQWLKKICF